MSTRRLLAAFAFLAASSCTGPEGPAGPRGPAGPTGAVGGSCAVLENADGSASLTCPDGTRVIVRKPGGTCTVQTGPDGEADVSCPDGSTATIAPGRDGSSCAVSAGADGSVQVVCSDGTTATLAAPKDGESCQVAVGSDEAVVLSCPDGSTATIAAPADGKPCSVTGGADGSATIACPDGSTTVVAAGEDAQPCTLVDRADGSRVIVCPDGTEAVVQAGRRRHVILVIGDGMPLADEISASRYLTGSDDGLSFHAFPYQAHVTTWDVSAYDTEASLAGEPAYSPLTYDPRVGYDPSLGGDRPYPLVPDSAAIRGYFFPPGPTGGIAYVATDSASAATAMATGTKTSNGNIAWAPGDPADGALESSATRLRRERGMAIGVVSTVPFSHATPAAFVSHSTDRGQYHAIASEILTVTRPEVVVGGGHPAFFSPSGSADHTYVSEATLEATRAASDYVTVERAAGVAAGPALAAAASAAASSNKKLFGLFGGVGGNFDFGVPADAPGAPAVQQGSAENPTLAQAAVAALDVLSTDPDGLFLMVEQGDIDWANHANDFGHMIASVVDLDRAVQAIVDYVDRPGDALDWSNTTLIVTADHCNGYLRFGAKRLGKGELPGTPQSDWVTYATTGHTNELVSLYARGAGAGLFWHYANLYPGKALVDNTSVYAVTLGAARGAP